MFKDTFSDGDLAWHSTWNEIVIILHNRGIDPLDQHGLCFLYEIFSPSKGLVFDAPEWDLTHMDETRHV